MDVRVFLLGCLLLSGEALGQMPQSAPANSSQTGEAQAGFYKGVDDSAVIGLMNIVVKTPGRCGRSNRGSKEQTLAGEHQDHLLGQYARAMVGGGISESVTREKHVFALATGGRCHWNSLQNFCRALLMGLEEPQVDLLSDAVLLPPGADPAFVQLPEMQSAVPQGFWPVAIRSDNLGELLLDDLAATCPPLHGFVQDEATVGPLGSLLQNEELQARFDKLRAAISSQLRDGPRAREADPDLSLEDLEQGYESLRLLELDLQLEDATRSELDLFYWLFMYAKYASSSEVVNSLVHPVVSLLLQKIDAVSSSPREKAKIDRDRLVLLSVSDKLMVALNAFLFSYSHECFLKAILESPSGKNFCPGKVLPTSNLIFKIDQVLLSEKLVVLVDGAQLPFCAKSKLEDCSLETFSKALRLRLGSTRRLVPCTFRKTVYLSGYYDLLMAKVVLGLVVLLAYYIVRCGLLLLSGADRFGIVPATPDSELSEQTALSGSSLTA